VNSQRLHRAQVRQPHKLETVWHRHKLRGHVPASSGVIRPPAPPHLKQSWRTRPPSARISGHLVTPARAILPSAPVPDGTATAHLARPKPGFETPKPGAKTESKASSLMVGREPTTTPGAGRRLPPSSQGMVTAGLCARWVKLKLSFRTRIAQGSGAELGGFRRPTWVAGIIHVAGQRAAVARPAFHK